MPLDTPAKRDPMVPLLIFLSAITGLIDAVSVLGLGKVFTANMTGNVVFLGFALASTPGFAWPPFVVALLFFSIGAGVGGRITGAYAERGRRRWLIIAALIEAALLWTAAACALGYDHEALAPSWAMYAIIALTATAMGTRNATVRQLKVADLTTTVLTLTLTGLAADSSLSGGANPNWGRRIGALLSMLFGAFVGALLVLSTGLAVPLILAGLCAVIPTVAMVRDR